MQATPCPCNPEKPFATCCEPLLKERATAKTAEALMRSRYSAYVLGFPLYLVKTAHPLKTHPESVESAVQSTLQKIKWTGLEILKVDQGRETDKAGMVEYVASYTLSGQHLELHEKSRFEKINGEWRYTEGDILER